MTPERAADNALRALAIRLGPRGPLLFIDLETTGTSPDSDRIVQIAYSQVDATGEVTRRSLLVNPGIPIPADATTVHNIRDADVAGAPRFAQIAKAVVARLMAAEAIAGYNVLRFDLRMLAAECVRASVAFDPGRLVVIDSHGIFCRRERRDLAAAMRFYCDGAQHEGAHDAQADVDATARVLLGQLERYADLPSSTATLAEYSANRPSGALDSDGRIVWRDGAARLTFGKWAGVALEQVEKSYLEWLSRQSFPSSTMAIVQNALAEQFPTKAKEGEP